MAGWSNLHYKIKQKHNIVQATPEEARKTFLLGICFHYSLVQQWKYEKNISKCATKKQERLLHSLIYLDYRISFSTIQKNVGISSCKKERTKKVLYQQLSQLQTLLQPIVQNGNNIEHSEHSQTHTSLLLVQERWKHRYWI